MPRWLRTLLFLLLLLLALALAGGAAWWFLREPAQPAADPAPQPPVPDLAAEEPAAEEPDALPPADTREPSARLVYAVHDDGRRVEGRFGELHFEASANEDGSAVARYWLEGADADALEVDIASEREGRVDWAGQSYDGRGPLAADRIDALEALAAGPMLPGLARVPLDLACRPEAEPVPPAVGAALLMPWQLLLKYAIDQPAEAARKTALRADCAYFDRRQPGSPLGVPYPHLVSLSQEERIPVAVPYLPFDGKGQRGSQP